jgi:hypothetical protein
MVFFKIQKEKWLGLQFTRTDYLSLVLTHLRIRWTIPLKTNLLCLDHMPTPHLDMVTLQPTQSDIVTIQPKNI